MGPVATTMSDRGRILVLAPNWLGDAVMALPAIADVRRSFPSAHLAVAARASVAAMFELAPGLDRIVTLRWKGGLFDRAGLHADTESLRAGAYDVAVLLPNSFASAWLTRRASIPERWGYAGRQQASRRVLPTPHARVRRATRSARAAAGGRACRSRGRTAVAGGARVEPDAPDRGACAGGGVRHRQAVAARALRHAGVEAGGRTGRHLRARRGRGRRDRHAGGVRIGGRLCPAAHRRPCRRHDPA